MFLSFHSLKQLILLPVIVVLASCSSNPPENTDKSPELTDYITQIIKDPDAEFRVLEFDLNGTGMPDALVLMQGDKWCNQQGCLLLVLENMGDSYRLFTKTTGVNTPIKLLNSQKRGWRNFIVTDKNAESRVMIFDTVKYASDIEKLDIATPTQVQRSQVLMN